MRMRPIAVALLVLPLLAAAGCRDKLIGKETNVVVLNDSACDLTVFVDGWEAFTVRHGAAQTVDNVGSGRHVLEVKDQMDRLVDRRYVDLQDGEDYYWHLEKCATH
jgi:hypothetical protein